MMNNEQRGDGPNVPEVRGLEELGAEVVHLLAEVDELRAAGGELGPELAARVASVLEGVEELKVAAGGWRPAAGDLRAEETPQGS